MQSVKFEMEFVEHEKPLGEPVVRLYPPHVGYNMIHNARGRLTAEMAKNEWDQNRPFTCRDKVAGEIYLQITTSPVRGS